MKKIIYSLTLWTLIMGLVAVAPAYAREPTAEVTITQVMSQAPPATFDPATGVGTNYGTWSASGAIVDTGTAREDFRLNFVSGFLAGAHFLTAEELLTSSNPANTIRILINFGGCAFISDTELKCTGNWQIASGTGAYQGLAGQGTTEVIVNIALADQGLPSNFITSTGFGHLP